MQAVDLLGLVAGGFTTASLVPQVVKMWRTRSGDDLSAGMFLLLGAGVFLWMMYGIALGAMPIIAANGITLVIAMAILWLKYRYRKRR